MIKRRFYNWDELKKQIPLLKEYDNIFLDSLPKLIPILDKWAIRKDMEFVTLIPTSKDCCVIFNMLEIKNNKQQPSTIQG